MAKLLEKITRYCIKRRFYEMKLQKWIHNDMKLKCQHSYIMIKLK